MDRFSQKFDVFFRDDEGKYVLDGDGFIWTDGEKSPRKLFQCGPNEWTTHNLEPIAGNYRRDGTTYFPDARKGTVTISGKFPFYCTHHAVPVFALPCGNFTIVPYNVSFADLVRLHHGAKMKDAQSVKARKTYKRNLDASPMTFRCVNCNKPYETTNFMTSHCSFYCRNQRLMKIKKAEKDFGNFGIATEIDRVAKSERWKAMVNFDDVCALLEQMKGSLIRADLFPDGMQRPAAIILDRMRKRGMFKIVRIDPQTGVKVYVHVSV